MHASAKYSTRKIGILDGLGDTMPTSAGHNGCGTSGRRGQAKCRSQTKQRDLPAGIWDKVKTHPCFSEEAHHHYARMHVAVAPACNIQCNYCNRKYDCANESRPGVVSEKLSPEQAVKRVLAVASTLPQLTVLGIAGPGDALANPESTFKTFELVKKAAPDINLCLSTNGLMLPDHIDTIAKLNIDHVTITINTVDPEIGTQIYPWIFYKHKRYTGYEAAKILIDRQLHGLQMLTERGVLAKINSVMIPEINDQHLVEVNKAVKARGAFLHNIMPLISAPEHGTAFGVSGRRGPSAQELRLVQDSCEGDMTIMRHCRQCRADAVGLIGEDQHTELTTERLMAMQLGYDADTRRDYHAKVETERAAIIAAEQRAIARLAETSTDIKVLAAVATKGFGLINEHFGHAAEFQIYELSTAGAKFIGHRRVNVYCQGGYGEEDSLESIIRAINDCHAVFVAKIGDCPRAALLNAGITPVAQFANDFIGKSAIIWFKTYLDRVNGGEIAHMPRIDATARPGTPISVA